MAPLFCSKDYTTFKRPCPVFRPNGTNPFEPPEGSESHGPWSPVMVATSVICVIVALSCITIIVNSRRKEKRAQRQQTRRQQECEDGQESEDLSYWSLGMCYVCSFVGAGSDGDVDLSSDGEMDGMELQEMYSDYPPCYEECMGPATIELHFPADAPPPYSTIDSRRLQVRTISVELPPSYEAVCETCPPSASSLLPLPGPEAGPNSPQASPTHDDEAVVSSPEMTK